MVNGAGRPVTPVSCGDVTGVVYIQCATLAAGPGPEASENLVGPVKN